MGRRAWGIWIELFCLFTRTLSYVNVATTCWMFIYTPTTIFKHILFLNLSEILKLQIKIFLTIQTIVVPWCKLLLPTLVQPLEMEFGPNTLTPRFSDAQSGKWLLEGEGGNSERDQLIWYTFNARILMIWKWKEMTCLINRCKFHIDAHKCTSWNPAHSSLSRYFTIILTSILLLS